MFLNPWYGQVGGGGASEGARVHTVEGATATATAAATAVSAVGGDDDDDRVLSTTTDVNAQQGDNTIAGAITTVTDVEEERVDLRLRQGLRLFAECHFPNSLCFVIQTYIP